MEYEGVVVEETSAIHHKAWLQLADEEGKPAPMHRALQRADGMKAEQVRASCSCCCLDDLALLAAPFVTLWCFAGYPGSVLLDTQFCGGQKACAAQGGALQAAAGQPAAHACARA